MTVVATVWPTRPERKGQGIVSWLAPDGGLALVLDGERGAVLRAAGAQGAAVEEIAVGKPLRSRAWYRVWASVDTGSGAMAVGQAPLEASPAVDDAGTARRTAAVPLSPAGAGSLHIAACGGDPVQGHFNGKIERPYVIGAGPGGAGSPPAREPDPASPVIADWDFSRETPSQRVVDVGPSGWHGELVNLPARAMKGSAWTGQEHCWRHAPDHYGAIHFHDDDLHDCGWATDFSYTVPDDLPSGAYAARLSCGEHQDMIPFFVRPRLGAPGAPVCVIVPTFTYTVYGNYSRGLTNDEYRARARAWGARETTADDHREYGLSTYNFHRGRERNLLRVAAAAGAQPAFGVPELRGRARIGPSPLPGRHPPLRLAGGERLPVRRGDRRGPAPRGPRPHRPLPGRIDRVAPRVPHRPHPRRPGAVSRRGRPPDVPRRQRLLLAGRAARRRPRGGSRSGVPRAGSALGRPSPGSTTTPSTDSTEACGGATTARRSASPGSDSRGRDSSSARTTCAPPGPTTPARRGYSRASRTGSSGTSG